MRVQACLEDPSAVVYRASWLADLTASGWPTQEGKFIIGKEDVKQGQMLVVTTVVPYAKARVNVIDPATDTAEGIDHISPGKGDNSFLFEPRITSQAAYGMAAIQQAAMTNSIGATSSNNVFPGGIVTITDRPEDVFSWTVNGTAKAFAVPGGQTLAVLFSLMPYAFTNPINQRYYIGTPPIADPNAAAYRRIDYAGVLMGGVMLPKQRFDYIHSIRSVDSPPQLVARGV
jgi:hypothetical protein